MLSLSASTCSVSAQNQCSNTQLGAVKRNVRPPTHLSIHLSVPKQRHACYRSPPVWICRLQGNFQVYTPYAEGCLMTAKSNLSSVHIFCVSFSSKHHEWLRACLTTTTFHLHQTTIIADIACNSDKLKNGKLSTPMAVMYYGWRWVFCFIYIYFFFFLGLQNVRLFSQISQAIPFPK